MTYQELRNYTRNTILQRTEKGPLFSWVDINPTELCNRTCEFCPRGVDYPNSNLHINDNVIDKIETDLIDIDFKGIINICGNGEPLLSNNITRLISKLSPFNVEMVTNGDILTEKVIQTIFNLGLSHVNVSLYDGEYQIEEFTKKFESVGIIEYTLREYWKPLPYLNNRAGTIDVGNPFVDKPCYYMHYSIQIDWNGDILFCVQSIYNKKIKHGNIIGVYSLKDIWYGESMTKYRNLLIEGRNHEPCSSCNVNGTLFGGNFLDG